MFFQNVERMSHEAPNDLMTLEEYQRFTNGIKSFGASCDMPQQQFKQYLSRNPTKKHIANSDMLYHSGSTPRAYEENSRGMSYEKLY